MKRSDYEALARAAQMDAGSTMNRAETGGAQGLFGRTIMLASQSLSLVPAPRVIDVSTKSGAPCVWTICLGAPNRFNPSIGATPPSLSIDNDLSFVNVGYGAGGSVNQVEIDWGQGRTFQVFGSMVTVDAFVFRRSISVGAPDLLLPVFIVPGSLGPPNDVTRTVRYNTLVGVGAAQSAAIPPMAYRCRFYEQTSYAVGKQVDFIFERDNFTAQVARVSFANAAGGNPLWSAWQSGMLVPPYATALRLENTAASTLTNPFIVYELNL